MNVAPTKFPELNAVLAELVRQMHEVLDDQLVAVYLQGSFGLGAGDVDSDVDFTAVIERDLTPEQIEQINTMHTRIFQLNSHWAQHLEGSYFPKALIRDPDPTKRAIPYLDNGQQTLQMSAHDNELVVRWQVRERGIPLFGVPAQELIAPIDPEALRQEIRTTMHDWGREIVDGTYTIKNRWAQPFVVLSYCRMLQTLATGTIESKYAAVQWAKQNLDARWHELVEFSWSERDNPSQKYQQPADQARIEQTLDFVRYAVEKNKEHRT